ncbi:MAG: DUF4129 domain-containing protein [Thermoplasmata archaeon]
MVLLRNERSGLLAVALVLGAAFLLANLAFNLQNLTIAPDAFPADQEDPNSESPVFPVQTGDVRPFMQAVTIVLAVAFLINLFLLIRHKEARRPFLIELAGLFLGLAVVLAVLLILDAFAGLPFFTPQEGGQVLPGTGTDVPGSSSGISAAPVGFGIIAVAVLALVLLLLYSRRFGQRSDSELIAEAKRRAIDRLQEAIYRLEMGEEVRSAILRCYADMTRLFRRRGLTYGRELTARELEALAGERLDISDESSVRLRELFEEARYSAHPLHEGYKRTALECLRDVKRELEGPTPA